jgi:hypothetical protein
MHGTTKPVIHSCPPASCHLPLELDERSRAAIGARPRRLPPPRHVLPVLPHPTSIGNCSCSAVGRQLSIWRRLAPPRRRLPRAAGPVRRLAAVSRRHRAAPADPWRCAAAVEQRQARVHDSWSQEGEATDGHYNLFPPFFFQTIFGTLFTIRARDPKVEADRNITVFLQQKKQTYS